jgi:predicted permease
MQFSAITRSYARAPFLHAVIVLSLAIGLGVNTVIFSWLKQAVISPLPGLNAEALALETRDDTGNYVPISWLEYLDVRAMLPSFAGVLAHRPRAYNLGEEGRDIRVFGTLVSDNYFSLLGLRPALGRFFQPEESTRPGAAPVAVLSHQFWRRHYGDDPAVLGRTLRLNGRVLTIVGVAPEGFHGAMHSLSFDVFLPLTIAAELQPATTELTKRTTRNYYMLAVLKPGVSDAMARGELTAAAARLRADYPDTNKGFSLEIMPLWRAPRGGQMATTGLLTLQAFALLILLVVCANTASLQLARASTRRREMGVRLALGAGPGRIISQLLCESVLLSLAGAGLGLLLAVWGVDLIRQMPVPGNLPVRLGLELDWGGLLFALLLGAGCGVLFGLAPALQLGRGDVQSALRAGRGSTAGRSRL